MNLDRTCRDWSIHVEPGVVEGIRSARQETKNSKPWQWLSRIEVSGRIDSKATQFFAEFRRPELILIWYDEVNGRCFIRHETMPSKASGHMNGKIFSQMPIQRLVSNFRKASRRPGFKRVQCLFLTFSDLIIFFIFSFFSLIFLNFFHNIWNQIFMSFQVWKFPIFTLLSHRLDGKVWIVVIKLINSLLNSVIMKCLWCFRTTNIIIWDTKLKSKIDSQQTSWFSETYRKFVKVERKSSVFFHSTFQLIQLTNLRHKFSYFLLIIDKKDL